MPIMPIPDDWDEQTWSCYMIEWPNSQLWTGILRGLITLPLRGRFWDEKTGSILDIIEIGREIERRNPITMSCQDIVNQLSIIANAIVSVDVNISEQVTVNQNLVNAVTAQSNAFATSQSWANAVSASYANAVLIQDIKIDIRNFGDAYPPITEPEAEAAGLTTTPTSETEACRTAYWLVRSAYQFCLWMSQNYQAYWLSSTEALLGFLAWAVKLGADTNGLPGLLQFPPAALTTIVEALQYINANIAIDVFLDDFAEFLDTRFDDVVCEIFTAYINGETALAAAGIAALATAEGLPSIAIVFISAIFNTNNISHVFLVPATLLIPDVPPGYECCPQPGQ